MAVQALYPFAKSLLNSPCVKEKLLILSRSATSIFCRELFVHNASRGTGKHVGRSQRRLFSLAASAQHTCPKIQTKDMLYAARVSQTANATLLRLASAEHSSIRTANACRSFVMTSHTGSQFGIGQADPDKRGQGHTSASFSEESWALRLANENGYLSWCRNTYLTTVVAVAMMGEGTTVLAEHAAEGAFVVAGLNLLWGTYSYIYNIIRLRGRVGMSRFGGLLSISLALLHLVLWLMVCSLYLGYSDDVPDAEAINEEAEPEHHDV